MQRMASKIAVAAIATTVASASLAQSAQQFDADCTVSYSLKWPDEPKETGTEARRYRGDLQQGKFCTGKCDTIYSLPSAANPSQLNLSHQSYYKGRPAMFINAVLNRQTGVYVENWNSGGGTYTATGTCRRERFSGFPAAVF